MDTSHPNAGQNQGMSVGFYLRQVVVKLLEVDAAFTARLSPPPLRLVRRIARTLSRNHSTNPITVAVIGCGSKRRWIVLDGRARLAAALEANVTELNAYVAEMTEAEALLYAGKANHTNGIMLSRDEQRRAAAMIAEAKPGWPARQIAEITAMTVDEAALCKSQVPL